MMILASSFGYQAFASDIVSSSGETSNQNSSLMVQTMQSNLEDDNKIKDSLSNLEQGTDLSRNSYTSENKFSNTELNRLEDSLKETPQQNNKTNKIEREVKRVVRDAKSIFRAFFK